MRLIAGKSKSNIDMIISSQADSPSEGSTTKKIIAKAKCLTSQICIFYYKEVIKIRTFNEEIEKEICKLYQEDGQTLTFLRQKYHCRIEAIKNVLNKYNISVRKRGTTKNKNIREDFFDNIDSEEKAYFLGLLFTDGNVQSDKTEKRSPQIRIQLKISDIKILQDFRTILNIQSKITYDKRKNKECAVLSFRNKHIADSLSKYGVVPNKTYLTKHLPDIPEQFKIHFLRGLLDGDGSIYQEKNGKFRIDFCSYHQSICEDFRQMCNSLLDENNTNRIENYGTAYHIRFSKQSIVKQLATVLYKESKISLARKYSLAERIFEDKSEEDIVYSDH